MGYGTTSPGFDYILNIPYTITIYMDSQSILIGIVIGLIVGAGIGYLMAPSTDVSEYESQMSQLLSQISENDDIIDQLEGRARAHWSFEVSSRRWICRR